MEIKVPEPDTVLAAIAHVRNKDGGVISSALEPLRPLDSSAFNLYPKPISAALFTRQALHFSNAVHSTRRKVMSSTKDAATNATETGSGTESTNDERCGDAVCGMIRAAMPCPAGCPL